MSAHLCSACGSQHEPLIPTAPGAAMCPACKRQAAILLTGARIGDEKVRAAEQEESC